MESSPGNSPAPLDAATLAQDRPRYSICTLVNNNALYERMVASFKAAGFDGDCCEYLYIDTQTNPEFDAYSGLNHLLFQARGTRVILTHQDVFPIEDETVLAARLTELEALDANWAVAGNAGIDARKRRHQVFVDLYGVYRQTSQFPSAVVTLDENFMVVNAAANVGFSQDLKGFHMYGPDLVTQALTAGRNAYVIDYKVHHIGRGTVDQSFYQCLDAFEAKYARAFRGRVIRTTIIPALINSGVLTKLYFKLKRNWRQWRENWSPLKHMSSKLNTRLVQRKRDKNDGTYRLGNHSFQLNDNTSDDIKVAMARNLYRSLERYLIDRWLPADLPVVEIGGGWGVISRFVGDKLQDQVSHIVAEADKDLAVLCDENANRGQRASKAQICNVHIDTGISTGQPSHLPLDEFIHTNGIEAPFSLIADMDGGEAELLAANSQALAMASFVLVRQPYHDGHELTGPDDAIIDALEKAELEIVSSISNVAVAIRPDRSGSDQQQAR